MAADRVFPKNTNFRPKRSGSLMHVDPYQSSAWNTSLEGRKKWILFPPEIDKKTALGLNLI